LRQARRRGDIVERMRFVASSSSGLGLLALAVFGLSVTVSGCKKDPPDEALFGDLDPPTPNKLKGVYQAVIDEAGMSTEIRLQFDSGTLEGALHCTPKNPAYAPISVGSQIDLSTNDIDAASGTFTIDNFTMDKQVDVIDCQGGLRGGTYNFKVENLKLTLTLPGIAEPIIYGKIGDVT
jgi:hypothetical protein